MSLSRWLIKHCPSLTIAHQLHEVAVSGLESGVGGWEWGAKLTWWQKRNKSGETSAAFLSGQPGRQGRSLGNQHVPSHCGCATAVHHFLEARGEGQGISCPKDAADAVWKG